jgi:hypothetical protein
MYVAYVLPTQLPYQGISQFMLVGFDGDNAVGIP